LQLAATDEITATATDSDGNTSEFSECRADLSITKRDAPDPVAPGGSLTYVLDVHNAGPAAATKTIVRDQLPAGAVVYQSAAPSQGTCELAFFGNWILCDLGNLPRGADAQVTIVVEVGPFSTGTLSNTAEVSSGDYQADPDPSNNTATATTEIGNDDVAPRLHLRKVVVNDSGGTAKESDFPLTADGTGDNDLSGPSPVDSGAGLLADTWTLSETTVAGYAASSWSCDGGRQDGAKITLGIGEEATCTITNDDRPGTIVVKKIVKPVGGLTSFAFQATGWGYTSFSLAAGEQNSQTLNAGSYTVKELVPLGWVLTGVGQNPPDPNNPTGCGVIGSGGSSGHGDLNTRSATISLKNGDAVICVFENTGQGATRTQGFWATHSQLANIAWFGGTAFGHTFPGVANSTGIGDRTLCGRPIDTLGKLMGAFWSDISKTTTAKKRSALDQSRMQLLQQLLAAELNASAFGSVPSGGAGVFTTWEAAYCGTNQTAIQSSQQRAGAFNSQGDSSTFTPGTSADSKTGRAAANYSFWDVVP
jgi:uncharacterized repeat protein (TIGR01451 family)